MSEEMTLHWSFWCLNYSLRWLLRNLQAFFLVSLVPKSLVKATNQVWSKFLFFTIQRFSSTLSWNWKAWWTETSCGKAEKSPSCSENIKSESSLWCCANLIPTIAGFLRMPLRRDHNLSGFLWWWCQLRHQTQTWHFLCLWRRSCESRFLSHLDACSGPRTALWCSYQRPHTCWVLVKKTSREHLICRF